MMNAAFMLFSDAEGRISSEPPSISFLDHGFLFGDSIYEAVRVYDRILFAWDEHCERLLQSAERLRIPVKTLIPELEKRMLALLSNLNESEAAIRVIITRGVGRLHIDYRSCQAPQIYLAAWKFESSMKPDSIRVMIPKIRRNSREALDPAIKSGNYLNCVMALQEALDAGYDDALLKNSRGEITELTTSNIGWVSGGRLFTPDLGTGILHGITRRLLTQLSDVCVGHFSEADLRKADEIFALSSFKELVPVSEIQFEDGSVQKYEQVPETTKLGANFHDMIRKRLPRERLRF